jgi:hypothetical protein
MPITPRSDCWFSFAGGRPINFKIDRLSRTGGASQRQMKKVFAVNSKCKDNQVMSKLSWQYMRETILKQNREHQNDHTFSEKQSSGG